MIYVFSYLISYIIYIYGKNISKPTSEITSIDFLFKNKYLFLLFLYYNISKKLDYISIYTNKYSILSFLQYINQKFEHAKNDDFKYLLFVVDVDDCVS